MIFRGEPFSIRKPPHLKSGPVLLSWFAGLFTLAAQATLTDHAQLAQDAASLLPFLESPLAQQLGLYALLGCAGLGYSFYLIPATFPPLQSPDAISLEVPRRQPGMKQHPLNAIDYSYVVLNAMCLPGLFYHFACLMRSWGLDLAAPPCFGVYPDSPLELAAVLPQSAVVLAGYFVAYEFVYYHWHRALHEVPTLYKWVHRHHHQQTYPDRAVLDTLNTGCVESQLGLYLQLGVLLAGDKLLGVADLRAGIWFFAIAGYLSVLEHDKYERSLPFGLFRADEHHMHHAYVRCNYSPYSTLWDRVFGTHKPFAVKKAAAVASDAAPASPTDLRKLPPIASVTLPLRASGAAMRTARDDDHEDSTVVSALNLFSSLFGLRKSRDPPRVGAIERDFNRVLSERIWAKHLGMGSPLGTGSTLDELPSRSVHLHAPASNKLSSPLIHGKNDAGPEHDKADSGEAQVVTRDSGEAQVVTRGLAYSIAGSVNALVFLMFLAVSFHLEAPAY